MRSAAAVEFKMSILTSERTSGFEDGCGNCQTFITVVSLPAITTFWQLTKSSFGVVCRRFGDGYCH